MLSDPRLSLCLSRELGYDGRVRVRNDDFDTEHPFFRKGYDAIGRLCMGMYPRHTGNMASRATIGNPASSRTGGRCSRRRQNASIARAQQVQYPVELIEARIVQCQRAAAGPRLESDAQP